MRAFLIVTGLVLAGGTVATSLTQVRPGERAVVRRFGRILEDKPGPGLFIGLPWGLDKVERIQLGKVRQVEVGASEDEASTASEAPQAGQYLTGDHNLVNIQAVIHYRVIEDELEQFFLQQGQVEPLIARTAEAVLADWAAGQGIDEILLRGKNTLPPWLAERVQRALAPYGLGVQVEQASIAKLSPPAEVKAAFDRVGQEQTRIGTQVYQAQQRAERKLAEAQSEQFQIQRLTAAYAREQELAARAEADTFRRRLEQYRKLRADDPAYLKTLWLDGMTRIYTAMRQSGRLDVLDHYLSANGLTITQFPLLPKKK